MKKAVSLIISLVLIIMITIVSATTAYYWLTEIQGDMQMEAEVSQSELTEQVRGTIEIERFEHNSSASTIEIIMHNAGTRQLKEIGDSGDLITISSDVHSCVDGFNSSTCAVCPFDFGVSEVKVVTLNLSGTNCQTLRKGQQYTVNLNLGDAIIYTSFVADIS